MAAQTIASVYTILRALEVDNTGALDGWVDDADLDLDEDEMPADGGGRRGAGDDGSGDEEGRWEVGDDDLELPTDLRAAAHCGDDKESGFYVVPTRGQPAMHGWAAHSKATVDHATTGSSETVFHHLHDQIRVVNFEPFLNY